MHVNRFHIFASFITISLIYTPISLCQNEQFDDCGESITCGSQNFGYPFYGDGRSESCGYPGFSLSCENDVALITIQSVVYRVLEADSTTRALKVAREDLWNDLCPSNTISNTALDFNIFNYDFNYQNITVYYGCVLNPGQTLSLPNYFDCKSNEITSYSFYLTSDALFPNYGRIVRCDRAIHVPVSSQSFASLENLNTSANNLKTALAGGFGLQWFADNEKCDRCSLSGGRCGHDASKNSFVCFCTDRTYGEACNDNTRSASAPSKSKNSLGIGLGIAGAVVAAIAIGLSIFFCRRRRKSRAIQATLSSEHLSKDIKTTPSSKPFISPASSTYTESIPSFPLSKSDLGRGSSYFGVQMFSYSELEEATDNFNDSRELGDGGFGAVYYGNLADGREVAVKRLYENNFKRVEQFMNEIQILARLRHKHLVHLYGCTSRRSRDLLLVYEYIPNGTVADHLHGKRAGSGLLSWSIRLKIAIETADALAYLHESDIIHRDVKTTNILLDNDFQVKVADFGLSRLFPLDVTHVSTAPQGTPGYVDPEYYQCYHLTEKSDVYSFGVVLIELISSLQAVDITRHRQEINLANMAVNKIQNHELNELVDQSLGFETNSSVKKMVSSVAELAFRCLQQDRDMRPSMQEIQEALREVQNEELNKQKEEIVEIVVDDVALLKGISDPSSPNFTDKTTSSSTSNSM